MKRFLFTAFAVIMSVAIVLLAIEITVRIIWKDCPQNIAPSDEPIFMAADEPGAVMTLIPGATGYHSLTHFRFNSLGYRGPEYSPEHEGVRIVVAGDSFVYGYALPENRSLAAYLQKRLRTTGLKNAEVINAGVPAYNIEQNIARVSKAAADYHPDIVIVSFIHNDFANTFYELGTGVMPVLTTSDEADNPQKNLLGRIADRMLPVLSRGTKPSLSVKIKYSIANALESYKYFAFKMHKAGSNYPRSGRELTFPQTESRQLDVLIWGRVEKAMADFRRLADENGFEPVLMIFMDFNVEGKPIIKLKRIAAKHHIRIIDLSPLWGSEIEYARRYTIEWDSHPNSLANQEAARILLDFLFYEQLVPLKVSTEERNRYSDYLSKSRRHERELTSLAAKQNRIEAKLRKGFVSDLRPGRKKNADQLLYGWWGGDPFSWDTGAGRWMARQSAFFLKTPAGGARKLLLEGYRVESQSPPPPMRIVVDCGEGSGGIIGIPPGNFKISINLKETQRMLKLIECEIFSTRVVTPLSLGKSKYDYRFISAAFTRLVLK